MSPRSAAEYVRKKLKHDAAKRKKKRRRKKISGGGDVKTKKKKKRKGKLSYVNFLWGKWFFFCQIYKFNEKFWNSSKESENGNGNAELMEKLAKKNWPGPNKNRSNLRINIFIQPQEIYSKNVVYLLQNQNLWPVLVRQLFVYL